jgi:hypothetical protein
MLAALLFACAVCTGATVVAQGRQGGGPPVTPRAAAPVDLTGYWVSVVTEDWRWRMMTPPKGDFASIPLNAEGQRVMNGWDPSKDGQCEAFGAGGIMRMPGRLHVTWDGDTALKIETDAGQQVRMLRFGAASPDAPARSLQGYSVAAWDVPQAGRGGGPRPAWGSLRVTTTALRPGWLRRNGVPYSENAVVTENFDRHSEGDAGEWLTVTTTVDDPKYLGQPFITSSSFKREADGSKFNPVPCRDVP